ncbi:MAG: hypothetical protein RMK29_13800 [Myxococcales bacterium]|nr:hypothetical protein [Myxococcales bacterium]
MSLDAPSQLLDSLVATTAALLPDREPVPLRGREQERLLRLEQAALHLLGLPPTGTSADDRTLLRSAAALRQRAAAVLARLGQHARLEMQAALERALVRWDQAGDLVLLPPSVREEVVGVHRACDQALEHLQGLPGRSPAALALLLAVAEATLALDAACALLKAVEVRFVMLVRERLRQREGGEREALLPQGQPFLNLGGALCAVATAFAGGGHG